MSEITKPTASKATDEALGVTNISKAMARRQMLLKSLGKGTAVIAAASAPISTLAQSTTLITPAGKNGGAAGLRCTVSGMQSGVNSRVTDTAICGGYSPGWWGQVADSQAEGSNRIPRQTWPVPYTNLCTDTFTKTGTDDPGKTFTGKTLFNVMDEQTFSSTKTRHWIGAFLNGYPSTSGGFANFPYTAQEILNSYNSVAGAPNRDKLYSLIVTYLELHGPQ